MPMSDVFPSIASDEPIRANVHGHALIVTVSGPARLGALLTLIEGADTSLRIFYYIFANDAVGLRVREALIDACNRGVKVQLLVDGFGTGDPDLHFYQPLIEAGAAFASFHPRWGRSYLLRNHQKMAIADKRTVLLGGANVALSYFETASTGAGWHDLCLLVEGPNVAQLARYFDLLSRWIRSDKPKIRTLTAILARKSDATGPLRWLFGGPFRRLSPLTYAVKADVQKATRLDLIQAYFAPNWAMLRRIARVGKRGTARLISASKSDNMTTIAAARHCYRRILRGGVQVFEYRPRKLHMKLIIADDAVYIGSANFDMRSLFINLEIMVRVEDTVFANQMRRFFEGELSNCEIIDRPAYEKRTGFMARIHQFFAYYLVSTIDYTVTRRYLRRL
jgi:cardiolipin synthase A/B